MLNRVTIMGRLVADPELRTIENGVQVCSFRIACDEDYKSKDGQRDTNFINVKAWRGIAEFIGKYFTKGRMIVVDGRLSAGSYTNKDGNQRYYTEIVADNVYFGDTKPKDEAQPASGAYGAGGDKGAAPFSAKPGAQGDDGYPF